MGGEGKGKGWDEQGRERQGEDGKGTRVERNENVAIYVSILFCYICKYAVLNEQLRWRDVTNLFIARIHTHTQTHTHTHKHTHRERDTHTHKHGEFSSAQNDRTI